MKSFDYYQKCMEKTELSENSISTYMRNLRKIFKEHFACTTPNPLFFKDHVSTIEYIDSLPTNASRKTMCTSIIVMLKHHPVFPKKIKEIYSKKLTSIAYEQNQVYIENQRSEKENLNWVTKEEIEEKISFLEKEMNRQATPRQKLVSAQKHLILKLYNEIPPLRNDYAFTCIFPKKKDVPEDNLCNCIVLDEAKMYLKVYKTSKFYGTKEITIPSTIINLIKDFESLKKKMNKNIPHNYLLIKCDFTPMDKLNLTKTLNKIFYPKKVSTTVLRKVYLSYKYPIQHSIQEMQKDADIMGHDFMTARKIYTKIT